MGHILDKVKLCHFKWSHEPKKFSNYMQGLKSAILAIFQTGRDGQIVSAALKNPISDKFEQDQTCFN